MGLFSCVHVVMWHVELLRWARALIHPFRCKKHMIVFCAIVERESIIYFLQLAAHGIL